MTGMGASALTVIVHGGMPFVSVSDLAGALSSMVDSMPEGSEQRKPLLMLTAAFEGMLAPRGPRQQLAAHPCKTCQQPVVTLPAFGQVEPVDVEVFGSADGEWVPVDLPNGTTQLVRWTPNLDDGETVRVDTHVCEAQS